jgi:hypothetical protein
MSLALFGLLLLVVGVLLGWKKPRAGFAVFVGVLLGVVIAASHGPLVGPSQDLVDAIRSGINSVAADVMGGMS